MKRVRDCGSDAAILRREVVERLDCLGVAQDNGHLPSFGAERGLALGARLGGCHGLAAGNVAEALGLLAGDPQAVTGRVAANLENGRVGVDMAQALHVGVRGTDAGQNVGQKAPLAWPSADQIRQVVVDGEGLVLVHVSATVGPIPTMCPSYPVTSDVSTTVRREAE